MPKFILSDLSEFQNQLKKEIIQKDFAKAENKNLVVSFFLKKIYDITDCPSDLEGHEGNVTPTRRDNMLKWYKETDGNAIYGYSIKKKDAENLFFEAMNKLSPSSDFRRGIYAHLRKANSKSDFVILIEPVFFKHAGGGQNIQHNLSEAVTTNYFVLDLTNSTKIHTDPKYTKNNYPEIDSSTNKPVAQRAFLPYDTLSFFVQHLKGDYDEIKFELARNAPNGRITFILSFQKGNDPVSSIICDNGTAYEGMLMDDHDLIPPPDVD